MTPASHAPPLAASSEPSFSPRLAPILLVLAAALGVRLLLIALAHATDSQFADPRFSDADSFLKVAASIIDRSQSAELTFYDTRVFPFWSLCEALLLSIGLSAYGIQVATLLLSIAVPWMYWQIGGRPSIALILALCPPAWLLSSILPMSEAIYLFLGLVVALCVARGKLGWAGVAAGAMIATRPFGVAWAVPLVCVAGWQSLQQRQWLPLAKAALGCTVGVLPFFATNLWLYDELFRQVRIYSAPLDTLNLDPERYAALGAPKGHWGVPFEHVLMTPWRVAVPLWKTGYVYAHVAALLVLLPVAVKALAKGWHDNRTCARWILLASFVLNSALIVSTGPYWGFHSFDRYFVWGLPGACVALEIFSAQRSWRWTALLTISSIGLAALAIVQRSA